MNTLLKKAAITTAVSCALSAQAFAGASVNVGAMSDYIWRGETQNANDASLMAGADYEASNGLYVGTWAAQVSNGADDLEVDIYGGYANETSNGLGYDIGVIKYIYPGANSDFTEVYGSVSYKIVEFGLAKTVSADSAASEGDLYTHLSLSKDIGPFGVSATVGNYDFDAGGDSKNYQLAASYSIPNGYGDLTAAFDTVDRSNDTSDSVASLTWSKAFDF